MVVNIEGKGRGVVSTRNFKKKEFLCEYTGECISEEEAKGRETAFLEDPDVVCYMYFFSFDDTKLW